MRMNRQETGIHEMSSNMKHENLETGNLRDEAGMGEQIGRARVLELDVASADVEEPGGQQSYGQNGSAFRHRFKGAAADVARLQAINHQYNHSERLKGGTQGDCLFLMSHV